MPRPAEPGRSALLRAGAEVATERGLKGLSVNAVVDAAGMAKGSFYHHFPDRRSYVIALHREYHDAIDAAVSLAIDGRQPGEGRLRAGIIAYLDACRRTRATKAFLAQSRTDTDLLDEVTARNAAATEKMRTDVGLLGWDDPGAIATLTVAMVAETALVELYADAEQPALRDAIFALLLANSPS
ncbi:MULTISPECIES: TetR/AcrR family transcriptional regulator [unclassified Gordonia (in: high G+C Gram-positive bacteria)]|uniref:TetR/AcrR family transcriptional regulator n=1 Tax=unclassified Gordonia (in: high G+C Gram-positive bacteria) TaxID=2657482 RepID=UPI001F0DE843|nr:TetR/AcrR family transcriptional regulator [Gordonia sp. ABSL49_1]MCH5643691.1 TetR/AcrR family transcriptional regulator [Gordonia sp. ABSL49_1]